MVTDPLPLPLPVATASSRLAAVQPGNPGGFIRVTVQFAEKFILRQQAATCRSGFTDLAPYLSDLRNLVSDGGFADAFGTRPRSGPGRASM